MELQSLEVQVCAKAETRCLEMAIFGKNPKDHCFYFFNCFRVKQMGFEQVFDNLIFKHMDALRDQTQSLFDYALNHCFLDICNVKQILTMIARIQLL